MIFLFQNIFSLEICTVSQKCTKNVLVNLYCQLFCFSFCCLFLFCKGLLFVCASAFYHKAVMVNTKSMPKYWSLLACLLITYLMPGGSHSNPNFVWFFFCLSLDFLLERGGGLTNSKHFEIPLFLLYGRFPRNIWEDD